MILLELTKSDTNNMADFFSTNLAWVLPEIERFSDHLIADIDDDYRKRMRSNCLWPLAALFLQV